MKGYSEHRGHSSKLDFDQATGQFITKPIEASFAPKAVPNAIVQKLVKLREQRLRKKTKQKAVKFLATIGPDLRDDVGMTEFYACASQS
jgi:hypothetical protein